MDNPPRVPTLTTSYAHGISSHSLLYKTVDQCLQASVARHPDREAMVFVEEGLRKTFAEFYQDVSHWPATVCFTAGQVSLELTTAVLPPIRGVKGPYCTHC